MPRLFYDIDRHQHAAIKINGFDGVSDNGQEIYNFLEQEGRKNVVLMGVHTNMCVLGRPFGIRQQKYLGKNAVLCRDLTDALYDPRDAPYVSHARGVVSHNISAAARQDIVVITRTDADEYPKSAPGQR